MFLEKSLNCRQGFDFFGLAAAMADEVLDSGDRRPARLLAMKAPDARVTPLAAAPGSETPAAVLLKYEIQYQVEHHAAAG
jgi:hypothetical protein